MLPVISIIVVCFIVTCVNFAIIILINIYVIMLCISIAITF